ncbi:SusD/RagB family nutrient-binding outer membrane lipoprotein [Carboxylicivirga mesophila]|uniref:SusD/RagB family nutrient-binding outer membrane lipoprotein n=2 Tax=Carboxylicivirga mesophila TaxID=1166478 RepID=A0ABS5KE34_9BACT|nr:SusD/RagB family nutrient-binding outer membrane lipoprotein [Carboxylicivirga mesophila]
MKNILSKILVVVLIAFTSCEDMDDINVNPNNPTDVSSSLIITDLIVSTSFRVASGDYNYYASVYAEHNVGIYNQFYTAEVRTTGPQVAATYNNTWEALYTNLYNAQVIIDKCSEEGSEAGNFHTLGIAQTIAAFNLATLTDGVGDAPWSEALQPGQIFNPVLDKQEDIYNDIIGLLDAAVANLAKETEYPSLDKQDPIFGGDADSWAKTANALLARYKLRLHAVKPDLNGVLANAEAGFSSAGEECKLDYNTIGGKSPFQAFFDDRDYYGASKSLHDKLIALSDPRADVLWKVHPEAEDQDNIVFAKSGDPDQVGQVQNLFSVSAVTSQDAPSFLISYHELEFIKAEAFARKDMDTEAEEALKNAIIASFEKIAYVFDEDDDVEQIAEDYFTNQVKPRFDANPLSEVMIQKYIALFEEEAFQAYCDIRRLKALGEGDIISLSHPEASKFPLRYTYGSSDVTTNKNIENAYADVDVFVDNVWWAGGSK